MKKAFPLLYRGVRVATNPTHGLVEKGLNDDNNNATNSPPLLGVPTSCLRRNHSWSSLSKTVEKPLAINLKDFKESVAAFKHNPMRRNSSANSLRPATASSHTKVTGGGGKEAALVQGLLLKKAHKKGKNMNIRPTKTQLLKSESSAALDKEKEKEEENEEQKHDREQMNAYYEKGVALEGKNDFVGAMICYLKSGKLGSAEAFYRASVIYELGLGQVKKDSGEAFKFLEWAAFLGHKIARHNAALQLLGSKPRPERSEEILAEFFLQRNIEEGVVKSMNYVGHRLLTSDKREEEERAVEILAMAARKNYAPSMYNLALCHMRGVGGLDADVTQARDLLEAASRLDHVTSMLALADLVEAGDVSSGTEPDPTEAARIRQRASTIGKLHDRQQLMRVAFQSAGYHGDLALSLTP